MRRTPCPFARQTRRSRGSIGADEVAEHLVVRCRREANLDVLEALFGNDVAVGRMRSADRIVRPWSIRTPTSPLPIAAVPCAFVPRKFRWPVGAFSCRVQCIALVLVTNVRVLPTLLAIPPCERPTPLPGGRTEARKGMTQKHKKPSALDVVYRN